MKMLSNNNNIDLYDKIYIKKIGKSIQKYNDSLGYFWIELAENLGFKIDNNLPSNKLKKACISFAASYLKHEENEKNKSSYVIKEEEKKVDRLITMQYTRINGKPYFKKAFFFQTNY